MYKLKYSSKIKKDLKTCQKRNLDLSLLEKVIDKLRIPEPLEDKNKDHNLKGDYNGFRECHITPDWLLIYRYHEEFLELARTGTHSDLFK
ncbi:MAG: type II toxin-antitoxin system YafQ family toxin [Firmicutes bacterium]|nr:type II toxin-antitoxin system YafQ family toxin [Bacillota bacterium]